MRKRRQRKSKKKIKRRKSAQNCKKLLISKALQSKNWKSKLRRRQRKTNAQKRNVFKLSKSARKKRPANVKHSESREKEKPGLQSNVELMKRTLNRQEQEPSALLRSEQPVKLKLVLNNRFNRASLRKRNRKLRVSIASNDVLSNSRNESQRLHRQESRIRKSRLSK